MDTTLVTPWTGLSGPYCPDTLNLKQRNWSRNILIIYKLIGLRGAQYYPQPEVTLPTKDVRCF